MILGAPATRCVTLAQVPTKTKTQHQTGKTTMIRTLSLVVGTILLGTLTGTGAGVAQTAPAPAAPAAATRMVTQAPLGERVVRMVRFNENGSSVDIVYDMAGTGLPQSTRVVRLENVNGMLEVIYDTAAPTMRVGNDGAVPRLTVGSGQMIEVQYDRR
jgi:hypothetical protein